MTNTLRNTFIFRLISYFIIAGYVFSVVTGLKKFNVWPRALSYYDPIDPSYMEPVFEIFSLVDFWTLYQWFLMSPRKMLMGHVFFISDLLSIDLHYFFSLEVCLMIIISCILLIKRFRSFYGKNALAEVFITGIIISMSYCMNGRMTWAFLGMSLFLWLDCYLERSDPLKSTEVTAIITAVMLSSLWMICVSSGSFSAGYTSMLLWVALILRKKACKSSVMIFMAWAIMLVALPTFMIAIFKNIIYFGGDPIAMVRMLQHGFGQWLIVYSLALLVGTFLLWRLRRKWLAPTGWQLPLLTLIVGILGSVYGISTVTVAIPGAIILMAYFISSLSKKSERSIN